MQGNTPTASPRQQFGAHMEQLARDFLESRGLDWIESNFTLRMGEIDLVMHEPVRDVLVFVEVRYRRNRNFGGPLASINYRKQERLRRTATAYLQRHRPAVRWTRIDVVGLQPAEPSADKSLQPDLNTSVNNQKQHGVEGCWPVPGTPLLFRGYEVLWIPNAISG